MYSRAFLRFWWVLLLGVVAAVVVGGFVANRHKSPTYTTHSQLLVDSAQHPFLRVSVPASSGAPTSSSTATAAKSAKTSATPDTQALVQAANFYPMLINSDVVQAYRLKHYGAIPGSVHAKAVDATQGVNRYVPSIFPVIEIDSSAPTARDAIRLATTTASGFQRWLAVRQKQEAIPAGQRISVVPIVMPTAAQESKHTRYSLALVAGAAVFAAFLGLAVLLDRAFPSRKRAEAPDERHVEQPGRVEVAHRVGL
jgi:hypothetical protein